MSHGLDIAFFPSLVSQAKQNKANIRGQAYYDFLCNDTSPIPQLYLYSESDILIPHEDVDGLVEQRHNVIGADLVFRKKWKSSRHCAHLIDNQEEYQTVVTSFLDICHSKSATPISRL